MLCHHSEHFYNHTKAYLIEKGRKMLIWNFKCHKKKQTNISRVAKHDREACIKNHPVKTIEARRERNEDREAYRM